MNGTAPLWTAVILMLFPLATKKASGQKRKKAYLGLALGFLGIVFIFLPNLMSDHSSELSGVLSLVGMGFCYGFCTVLNRRVLVRHGNEPPIDIRSFSFHQALVSFVFLFTLSFLFEKWPPLHIFTQLNILIAFIYLGCIASAIAFMFYYYLIREIGALKTSAVAYLIPVSALVFDALIFKNIPEWFSLIGVIFILVGLFFIRSDPTAV